MTRQDNREERNMDEKDLEKALETLRRGGTLLYPTDTVWGVGCDATDAAAVKRIYTLKERSDSKSMLVLVADLAQLGEYLEEIPEQAKELISSTDRPLTVIYPTPRGLARNLLAEDAALGIRVAAPGFAAELCRRLGHPVVSTSANISGEEAPRCFAEISQKIIDRADYVCESGRKEGSAARPSKIVKVSAGGITIIRE